MSRSADRRQAPAPSPPPAPGRRDGGFTLIEVIVALGIIMAVMTAVLPQLVVGIRSGETSRLVTQTKGVAQGQIERMRNLPYYVAPQAGEYIDVLDYYFRDLKAPKGPLSCTDSDGLAMPTTAWTGYVPDGGARCSYEPQTGPMYRYVVPHPASGTDPLAGFHVVVDTQFLSTPVAHGGSDVLTPPAGYNTQLAGHDTPISPQIGVTVTVLYDRAGVTRPVTTYTQIADQPTATSRIELTATATAVDIGSITTTDGAESLQSGLLNLTGSLSFASSARASLTAVSAGLATGAQATGAATTVSAPSGVTALPAGAGGLVGCGLACWGGSQVDLGVVTATDGLPNVGSVANPMQARLTDLSNLGLSFDSGPASQRRPGLDLAGPLVRLDTAATPTGSGVTASCTPSGTGAAAFVRSSGFLRTTSTSDPTPTVEACAVSSASVVSLFPTTFAPRGVLQVELVRAAARCVVSGAGHTAQPPTIDYRVVVRRYVPPPAPPDPPAPVDPVDPVDPADSVEPLELPEPVEPAGPGSYEDVLVITPGLTADDLAAIDPGTIDLGGGHTLGDYVASWSALVADAVEPTVANGTSAVTLSGVLKLTSQPVRLLDGVPGGDPASAVSLTLGQIGCSAMDAR